MTKHEVAILICKALGIYTFINALNSAPSVFAIFLNGPGGIAIFDSEPLPLALQLFMASMPSVLNVLASWFLWSQADWLAKFMTNDPTGQAFSRRGGAELHGIAFTSLGVFALLQAVPRLGKTVLSLLLLGRDSDDLRVEYPALAPAEIAGMVVQLGLGLWLFFGASGLVVLARSYRTIGLDKEHLTGHDETTS